ncbi:MAG: nitroreductase family protein [Muribaculaceae bacterium]|nr:nitroreductase family protein [Muribaculaceae bacterium]
MKNESYWTDRRTIRRYSDRPVSDALLKDMLQKAAHAPTTGNMQLYSVIISRTAEEKHALAAAHFNQPQVEGCSAVLTFCADLNRMTRWCQVRKADPGFDNLQSLIAAILDTSLIAQQFNTIAEQNGLGVCMLGTTTYNAPQIAKALGLPSLVVPVITLTVGYPAESPEDCGRLPVEAFIHNGRYNDYTPESIDKLYSEKEAREDSKRFVEENDKETLAQVFADVRYPRSNNEHFSTTFIEYLNSIGIKI